MDIKILNGKVVKEISLEELEKRIEIAKVDLQNAQNSLDALNGLKSQYNEYQSIKDSLNKKRVPFNQNDSIETLSKILEENKDKPDVEII